MLILLLPVVMPQSLTLHHQLVVEEVEEIIMQVVMVVLAVVVDVLMVLRVKVQPAKEMMVGTAKQIKVAAEVEKVVLVVLLLLVLVVLVVMDLQMPIKLEQQ
jgi:hypothetical protein